jgi:tetratricopeptide (TPR) repeat protein
MWEKRLGVWLRAATFCVGIAAACGLAYLVWDASRSNGLLIEPFSVPADLASRGLTGQAVANQVLGRLTEMQNATNSLRPSQSYASNWGDDIKVEIPETGVSIGEFYRFLRGWLGHDTHITGEIFHGADGFVIAARAKGQDDATFTGPDLDTLIRQAAERIYAVTQPYRYANFLDRNTFRPGASLRVAEAEAIYKRLVYDPNPVERAWAWNGLANLAYTFHGNLGQALEDYKKGTAALPSLWGGAGSMEYQLNHVEAELAAFRNYPRQGAAQLGGTNAVLTVYEGIAELLGDYVEVFRLAREGTEAIVGRNVYNHDQQWFRAGLALARMHDGVAARAWWQKMPPVEASTNNAGRALNSVRTIAALQDWQSVVTSEPEAEIAFRAFAPRSDLNTIFTRSLRPLLALAKVKLGDIDEAQLLIAHTPGDCYDCTWIRGEIASEAKQWARADYWYERAVSEAPSIPLAHARWGQSLLERGQPDAAIAQFTIANQKGPHFADPLEGWGEALMAKNQSHLAVAKFAEAEKYAPNWGRLHLKWGEALVYAGKKDEAKAQFARAAALDLTPSEKSELARVAHG